MSIMQMLFSFEGRLRRRDFWLCVLGLIVVQWVLQSICTMLFFPTVPTSVMVGPNGGVTVFTMFWERLGPSFALIGLLLLWPRLAIGVKRCHDRNKSGLWLLLGLIPILGWLWLLIDLGFLDGTPGPNKFGPSPKDVGGAAEAAA
jgi:uncharacterized membrane protein YhaH (DUF805 family)